MADIRLNRIMKQYNVGLQDLVDFLNKQGAGIENMSPNIKVSDKYMPAIAMHFVEDITMRWAAETWLVRNPGLYDVYRPSPAKAKMPHYHFHNMVKEQKLPFLIRSIVNRMGPTIITESRFVNILCDYQAFDETPSAKYVMRAIIDDGYAWKFLQGAKWDINARQLCCQFVNNTGFKLEIAWMIFQSLAYGLGWIDSIPQSIDNYIDNDHSL